MKVIIHKSNYTGLKIKLMFDEELNLFIINPKDFIINKNKSKINKSGILNIKTKK